MDPNKLLEEIRALQPFDDTIEEEDARTMLRDMYEKFEALDEWLSKGGYLPRDWLLAIGRSRAT